MSFSEIEVEILKKSIRKTDLNLLLRDIQKCDKAMILDVVEELSSYIGYDDEEKDIDQYGRLIDELIGKLLKFAIDS